MSPVPPHASPGPEEGDALLVTTTNPAETAIVGEALGALLGGGELILLQGDLGAGKTLLTQAIARALGVRGAVPSPTFLLERRHAGARLALRHWDFYRLDAASDLEELGFHDREPGEVVVVEWPERHPALLEEAGAWRIALRRDDREQHRHLTIEAPAGAEGATAMAALRAALARPD